MKGKRILLSPAGLSPPAITAPVPFIKPKTLVIISTSDRMVRESVKLIKIGLKFEMPRIKVEEVITEAEDIDSQKKAYELFNFLGRTLKKYSELGTVYLNLTGGRKGMLFILYFLSMFFPVEEAFYTITPDVKLYNQLLENLRGDIKSIYESSEEEAKRIYLEKREYFKKLLFPRECMIIKLPILPRSKREVLGMKDVLEGRTAKESEIVEILKKAGLIQKKRRKIFPIGYGEYMKDLI